ncbi:MAG: ferritin family protein [Phycisphaerales bacterium]|jgi:rubrerythrin
MKKFSSVDEVLDYAINREVEAHAFYVTLADMVEKPEMVKVLSDLASEELEHKAKLEAVKAGEIGIDEERVGNLGITSHAKDVEPHPKMSYVDLLIVGMKKEEASRKLYTDLATTAQTQELRDIFLKLAQEEAEHKLRFEIEYDLMTF